MKRTDFTIVAAAVALGMMTAVPAMAQMGPQGGGPRMQMFHGIDANRDGTVTRTEYDAYQTSRFDRFDRNKDGQITRAEYMGHDGGPPGRGAGRDAQFKAYDKNGDGTITRDEWNAWVADRYAARDANKDGNLSQQEMGSMGGGMMQGRPGMGPSGTPPMGGGMGPRGRQGG